VLRPDDSSAPRGDHKSFTHKYILKELELTRRDRLEEVERFEQELDKMARHYAGEARKAAAAELMAKHGLAS
jgi:hypothetical protein